MVPFSVFASGEWVFGSPKLARYNGVPAEEILGSPAPGYNTGDAMAEAQAIAAQLPPGVALAWTGLSYEEKLSGSQAPVMYALSLLVVFLCLAALYESWSIPLAVMLVFGRVRSLDQEALQRYLASEQAQRSARIGLVASIASAWLTLQADQALERLTSDTLDTYENTYQMTRRSAEVGTSSDLALSQSQTLVQGARSSMARYRRQVAEDRNLLALLIGGKLPADLVVGDWERQSLPEVPVGLLSDLLSRRPDILEAEFLLKAANADIGAARAAFFPRISLTAGAGSSSEALSGLFNGGSGVWSFFPQISLPIFNAGALQASLDVSQIEKDIQVARYEKAIQSAFREVSDGLAATETFGQQIEAQQGLVSASAKYYRLAESRYRIGVDSSLTLLDAQRTLFAEQQALISDQLAGRVATIDLYKALGGGWQG